MKMFQQVIISAALVLSAGTAMAMTGNNVNEPDGFHALSQFTNVERQGVRTLSDEQLGDIQGGRVSHDDLVSNWPKWILPYIRYSETLGPDPVPWKHYQAFFEPDPEPWNPGVEIT